jgi:organic radical activating enzyme
MSTSENKDLYCSLAFNSISFGPHGGSRPCCAVNTYFWQENKHVMPDYDNKLIKWFNNSDIVKLRQDLLNNKWNPICDLCKTREQHGQASTREIFNNTMKQHEETTGRSYVTREAEINDLSNIFLLDVTVGNKCNSACVMCNPSASSLYEKELFEITGEKPYYSKSINWFSEDVVPELVDKLPNLRAIQFAGGEPTISDPHVFMLKRLIEQGRSKDITLGYVTNSTSISDELLELWNEFSWKYITVSIDGVGKVNEYQRYPFTWKKVSEQFEKLKKITIEKQDYRINLSHTITSLNILTLPSMIEWWESQINDANQSGVEYIITSLPHIQCVNQPQTLDPIYMTKKMKDDCRVILDRFENGLNNQLKVKYKPAFDNIRANVLDVNIDETTQKDVWNKMKEYLKSLDKYRNKDIFKYLPYMELYW